jgi:predicted Zn-dependent protease
MLVLFAVPGSIWAQGRGGNDQQNPFSIADELFEQFVPQPTEADERALAEIAISRADETRHGKMMVDAYLADLKRQRIKVVRKGKDVEYLQALVAIIQPYMQQAERYPEIDVYVVQSEVPDARSFPGGSLFFYEGLLDLVRSEAALVGVVGYELSHLDRGHQLIALKQAQLFQRNIGSTAGQFDPRQFLTGGTQMARLMSRPFRPQDEQTADKDAVSWSYQAGYDSREFAEMLIALRERIAVKENIPIPGFLRTHPPTLERAETVIEVFDELQKKMPRPRLYIGQENLKKRVPRTEREFDE